jgi:hypothetical protein
MSKENARFNSEGETVALTSGFSVAKQVIGELT